MGLKFLDILLLPKSVYHKLNESRISLVLGVLFVGMVDILLPITQFQTLFIGKTGEKLFFNIAIAIVFVMIMGCVNIFFFIKPLFDFFKFLKKDAPLPEYNAGLMIKMAKVYIICHFMVVPFFIVTELLFINIAWVKNQMVLLVFVVLMVYFYQWIVVYWMAGIISRGANVLYQFELKQKLLVFIVILLWNYLLMLAMAFMVENWLLPLFR